MQQTHQQLYSLKFVVLMLTIQLEPLRKPSPLEQQDYLGFAQSPFLNHVLSFLPMTYKNALVLTLHQRNF